MYTCPPTLTNLWTYLTKLQNVFSKMQDVFVQIANWTYLNCKIKYTTCTVYAVRPTLTLDWILLASFHTTGFHSICWTGAFRFYWITPAQSYSISTTWDSFQFAFIASLISKWSINKRAFSFTNASKWGNTSSYLALGKKTIFAQYGQSVQSRCLN